MMVFYPAYSPVLLVLDREVVCGGLCGNNGRAIWLASFIPDEEHVSSESCSTRDTKYSVRDWLGASCNLLSLKTKFRCRAQDGMYVEERDSVMASFGCFCGSAYMLVLTPISACTFCSRLASPDCWQTSKKTPTPVSQRTSRCAQATER